MRGQVERVHRLLPLDEKRVKVRRWGVSMASTAGLIPRAARVRFPGAPAATVHPLLRSRYRCAIVGWGIRPTSYIETREALQQCGASFFVYALTLCAFGCVSPLSWRECAGKSNGAHRLLPLNGQRVKVRRRGVSMVSTEGLIRRSAPGSISRALQPRRSPERCAVVGDVLSSAVYQAFGSHRNARGVAVMRRLVFCPRAHLVRSGLRLRSELSASTGHESNAAPSVVFTETPLVLRRANLPSGFQLFQQSDS